MDPLVGALHAVGQLCRGFPVEPLEYLRVVATATADTERGTEIVLTLQFGSRQRFDDVDELVDRDQFATAEIQGIDNIAGGYELCADDAVVDVHEASRLLSVPPNLNGVLSRKLCFYHLSA